MEGLEQKLVEGLESIKTQVKQAADANAEVVAETKTKLEDFEKQLEEAKNNGVSLEVVQKMQEHLDLLDIKLQKRAFQVNSDNSIDGEIKSKFDDKNVKSAFEVMKNNSSSSVNIEVKAVGTMMLASYVGDRLTTEVDRTISKAPNRMPLFRNLINVSTIKGNKVTWVNKEANEGGPGMTAEGAKKSQVSWTYTEESADVKKITEFIKVSKEALDDLDFLRSEINSELIEGVELKLDEQISSGDGQGLNLKGILPQVPVFNVTGTPLDKSVSNANKRDVLRSAVALIRKNRFNANYIIINPMDGATMELEKGTDGHYILPPFTSVDGTKVGATLVVENEAIAEGEFLAGDFTKSNLRIKEEININVGYSDDDFVKNLVTILAEMRAVHYIKKHHKPAFVKGVFADAITAINKPVV
ncbi:phage major capsid protein [Elizabethkingia meningoseptica]|uniref:phage major capsid protein n=1 Tax=Elizabethkingia meningoseptica TaxID=238 RepID=UPI0023B13A0B|nr:phage major capsid protein [Elizabethkingia meningoseptica]MDE5507746.1 phage major capsid protein [Elizabethkingia meningoseptica]